MYKIDYDNPKLYKVNGELKKDFRFIDAYEYIKTEILRYDNDIKLPSHFALRLKGLMDGKFMCNNNITPNANYSIESIKETFTACKDKIHWALDNKDFNNEQQKLNYIFAIVEGNINDTVKVLKYKEKQQDKLDILDVSNLEYDGVKYEEKKKVEKFNKVADKLKDIW